MLLLCLTKSWLGCKSHCRRIPSANHGFPSLGFITYPGLLTVKQLTATQALLDESQRRLGEAVALCDAAQQRVAGETQRADRLAAERAILEAAEAAARAEATAAGQEKHKMAAQLIAAQVCNCTVLIMPEDEVYYHLVSTPIGAPHMRLSQERLCRSVLAHALD